MVMYYLQNFRLVVRFNIVTFQFFNVLFRIVFLFKVKKYFILFSPFSFHSALLSINTLPAKLAPSNLEPYKGTVKMWNEAEDTPLGCCCLKVPNPKK